MQCCSRTSSLPRLLLAIASLVVIDASAVLANYILFSQPTDTIQIPGNTVVSTRFTIEARIRILSSLPAQTALGRIFQEQRDFGEDKSLCVNSSGVIAASAWTDSAYDTSGPILYDGALTADAWHHIAFVRDITEQRLYVDGSLVASNGWTTSISNAANSGMSAGGFQPPTNSPFRVSFLGAVDTLRVSSSAEYSGSSFSTPPGDLPRDSSTLLLYNFNDPLESTIAADDGPNAWNGTLGTGYLGATSPTFVDFTPGDANGDGRVDLSDLLTLATDWQTSQRIWAEGDFNGDGEVNADDLGLLAANWQAGVAAPPAPSLEASLSGLGLPNVAAPEPLAGTIAAAGLLCCPRILRRPRKPSGRISMS
jgi:hypothetical protein